MNSRLTRVELAESARAGLLAEAARTFPQEACGLLWGAVSGDGVARIDRIVPAANLSPSPETRFEIDPVALIAAHRRAREGGEALLGWYHSHPTGAATLSATDRAMALRDGRIWALVAGGAIHFWRDGPEGLEALSSAPAQG